MQVDGTTTRYLTKADNGLDGEDSEDEFDEEALDPENEALAGFLRPEDVIAIEETTIMPKE